VPELSEIFGHGGEPQRDIGIVVVVAAGPIAETD